MNSRARSKIILLDKYTASGTAASHIYTPIVPLSTSEYSSIRISIIGEATAALELQLIINSDETSKYYADGLSSIGGSLAAIDISAAANFPIISANLITGALAFHSIIELLIPEGGLTNDQIGIISTSRAQATGSELLTGMLDVDFTTITEIEIQTSTSTWIAGTQITIHGILK